MFHSAPNSSYASPSPFRISAGRSSKKPTAVPGSDSDGPPFGIHSTLLAEGPSQPPSVYRSQRQHPTHTPILPKLPGVRAPTAGLIAGQAPYNSPPQASATAGPPGGYSHHVVLSRADPTSPRREQFEERPYYSPRDTIPVTYSTLPSSSRSPSHSNRRSTRGGDRFNRRNSRSSISKSSLDDSYSSSASSSSSSSSFAGSLPRRQSSQSSKRKASLRLSSTGRRSSSYKALAPRNSQYAVLGVPMTAQRHQIKRAYLALVSALPSNLEATNSLSCTIATCSWCTGAEVSGHHQREALEGSGRSRRGAHR